MCQIRMGAAVARFSSGLGGGTPRPPSLLTGSVSQYQGRIMHSKMKRFVVPGAMLVAPSAIPFSAEPCGFVVRFA